MSSTKDSLGSPPAETPSSEVVGRLLAAVERFGNKIPDTFTLFVWAICVLIGLSVALSLAGVSVINPITHAEVAARSLLSAEAFSWLTTSMIRNFVAFPPFGLIVVLAMGVGIAQRTKLLERVIQAMVMGIPRRGVTIMLCIICFFSHIASDVALLIMPAIGAIVFRAVGRHPLAGLCTAMAAVGSGYSANLIIVGLDVVMAGLTTSAAQIIDKQAHVSPVDNWYFTTTAVALLTIVVTLVTEKIVEPRLGVYEGAVEKTLEKADPRERRALAFTGLAALVLVGLVALAVIPETGILRNPETHGIIGSPFLKGIAALMFLLFAVTGITYGVFTGQIRSAKDAGKLATDTIRDMSGFIVLMFLIANFTAAIVWTNIGQVIATAGAALLQTLDMTGLAAQFLLMVVAAFLLIFIPSSSATWALLGPLFVPMFMMLGYTPAFTQLAMRVGMCSFIPVSPCNPFVPAAIRTGQEYDPSLGYGRYLSLLMPYVAASVLAWVLLFTAFYLLNLPIGPGITARMA